MPKKSNSGGNSPDSNPIFLIKKGSKAPRRVVGSELNKTSECESEYEPESNSEMDETSQCESEYESECELECELEYESEIDPNCESSSDSDDVAMKPTEYIKTRSKSQKINSSNTTTPNVNKKNDNTLHDITKRIESQNLKHVKPNLPNAQVLFNNEDLLELLSEIENSSNKMTQSQFTDQYLKLAKKLDWNKGLTNKEKKKYEKQYDEICSEMVKIPLISDILKLSMPLKDKAEFIHKLIILQGYAVDSFEFLHLRNVLNQTYLKHSMSNLTQEDIDRYNKLEKVLINEKVFIQPLKYRILSSNMTNKNKAYVYQRYQYWETLDSNNGEYNKLKNWIETALSIPTEIKPIGVNKSTPKSIDQYLYYVKEKLDKKIYGLHQVKEKILFFLNNKLSNDQTTGASLAICGLPGTAKTSIIQVLAEAIELPLTQLNLGGAHDASFLIGHGYTYEGSSPGAVVQALHDLKYKNGIIFIDEFDKISKTNHGAEISKSLLHIIDFSQNYKFHDRYLSSQFDIDLSKIWFIYSLNDKNMLDRTLRDRVSIIDVPGYTPIEKCLISSEFLIPTFLRNLNISEKNIVFPNETLLYLMRMIRERNMEICDEEGRSGVRQIKHILEHIIMKLNLLRNISYTGKRKYNRKLQLSYQIPNFQLPLVVSIDTLNQLNIQEVFPEQNTRHMSMYN